MKISSLIKFQPPEWSQWELGQVILLFRKELVVIGLLSLVVNVLMLAPTFYMLQVYDRVLVSQNEFTLFTLTAVIVFLFAVMAISEWLRTKILVRVGVSFDQIMSRRVFRATYEERLKASSINALETITDLNGVRTFMTGNGIIAFFDIPWSPIYIYVCFLLHPVLGWTALIFAATLLIMTFLSQWFMEGNVEVAMIERVKEHGLIVSKMRNPELIESMGMIAPLFRQWMKRHAKVIHIGDESSKISAYLAAANKFVRQAQGSLVLAIGAWLVATDQLRPSAMVAANLLVMRGVGPIDLIVGTWEQFVIAKVSFSRLANLLKNNPIKEAKSLPLPPAGHVVCSDLFAYAESHEGPILKGINLQFATGKVTAILGPSGSGKSTLSRCILGIWPQIEGRVLMDGHDIHEYDRQRLGPYMGYLPQDIELFAGNVAENIARFGELNTAEIIKAAELVGLHQAILALPWGYDTPITYAKGFLSGGQRQRLGLARALYGNPQVILLDEPNSNLDHEGEQFLFMAINALKEQGKTIFIVAHTPSVLSVVDFILTLKDGQVESYGPKEAVLGWASGK
jgi:ATP-binding cassette, subfamily C, bacterial exporter for protease/lipase